MAVFAMSVATPVALFPLAESTPGHRHTVRRPLVTDARLGAQYGEDLCTRTSLYQQVMQHPQPTDKP